MIAHVARKMRTESPGFGAHLVFQRALSPFKTHRSGKFLCIRRACGKLQKL